MHLSVFYLLAILTSANALADSAPVSPINAVSHTVNLFNGVSTTMATVGHPDIPMLPGGRRNMCSGSSLCTNGQKFRDDCAHAFLKLENVVYGTSGSGAGGVCHGKCGFFLEGKNCRATYEEFIEAYGTIRNVNNCLTCGYAFKPRTSEKCWIKFDYVSRCN